MSTAFQVSNNWLVNQLIIAGASVNLIDGNGQQKGYSPLLTAVMANYPFAADRLLDAGSDPDVGDCWGNTPLYHLINLHLNFTSLNDPGRKRHRSLNYDEQDPLAI
jgi:ankyrin repeat protein